MSNRDCFQGKEDLRNAQNLLKPVQPLSQISQNDPNPVSNGRTSRTVQPRVSARAFMMRMSVLFCAPPTKNASLTAGPTHLLTKP